MIDYIKVGGPWVEISTTSGTLPYVPTSTNPMQGAIRVVNGQQEVWNGTTWMVMYGGSVTIALTKRAEAIMDWAETKMLKEQKLIELAKTNPTVADAVNTVKHAEEQLDIILELIKETE